MGLRPCGHARHKACCSLASMGSSASAASNHHHSWSRRWTRTAVSSPTASRRRRPPWVPDVGRAIGHGGARLLHDAVAVVAEHADLLLRDADGHQRRRVAAERAHVGIRGWAGRWWTRARSSPACPAFFFIIFLTLF